MSGGKRALAAVGFGVCFLPAWLGMLCMAFGVAGILWFLCTGIFVAGLGTLVGGCVVPCLETRIKRS